MWLEELSLVPVVYRVIVCAVPCSVTWLQAEVSSMAVVGCSHAGSTAGHLELLM